MTEFEIAQIAMQLYNSHDDKILEDYHDCVAIVKKAHGVGADVKVENQTQCTCPQSCDKHAYCCVCNKYALAEYQRGLFEGKQTGKESGYKRGFGEGLNAGREIGNSFEWKKGYDEGVFQMGKGGGMEEVLRMLAERQSKTDEALTSLAESVKVLAQSQTEKKPIV